MGYIVYKGGIQHSEDFDLLEEFSAKHRTKIVSAELWGFERLPIGQLVVRWKNGAIGQFVGGDLHELREYVSSLDGWPKPVVFSRHLPHSAGMLYVSTNEPEKQVEEPHATKRVVRQRHSEVTHRTRRVRASV